LRIVTISPEVSGKEWEPLPEHSEKRVF